MSDIKEFFEENGHYHARGVYTGAELLELEQDFDRIVAHLSTSGEDVQGRWRGEALKKIEQGMETRIIHTHNVQKYSARWMQAMLQSDMLDITEQIIGPDIVLHHSKLFQKPAEKGSPFPMHQDWPYFPTEKDSMIAGIIHVSDATDEMGCLRVYPGSHKLGRLENASGQTDGPSALDDYPIEKAVPVECKAGDVVFFHYFTLHGSMPNRSNQTRKTVLFQVHAGDDRIEETEAGMAHVYERLALRGFNHSMKRSVAAQVQK